MAKRVDPLKEKQRKQKILLAFLSVVFLGVAGFQGPRLWKQLHPPPPPPRHASSSTSPTATPVTGTGTPSLAAPTLSGAAAGPATAGTGELVDVAAPPVQDGQLASFSRFASKDPFAQQIVEKSGASASSSGGTSVRPGGSSKQPSSPPPVSGRDPSPGTAVISVNGTLYTVPVGTDFPQASESDPSIVPLFHLISATAHSAKISIVGGSYSSGASAVTLKENVPVTLMNTADGTRYKLILKPVGTAVPTAAPTTTTSTTVTVPPPSSP